MEIVLSPEIKQFIEEQIQSGKYTSASEVVFAGIKLLEERERIYQGRFEQLKQEIEVGLRASAQGEVIESEIVFQRLRDRLQRSIA